MGTGTDRETAEGDSSSERRTALLPTSTHVVELGESVATAVCGLYLERLGARVTRVVGPDGRGALDDLPPLIGDGNDAVSTLAVWLRQGKKVQSLDVSTESGRDELAVLLTDADVVLVDGRSVDWAKRGLQVDQIRQMAPTAVVGQVTPWGDEGPYADLRGGELQAQAAGGLMNLIGLSDREPVRLGGHPMQTATGLLALDGVMAALFRRQNTGRGAFFTVSEFESTAYVEWKIASAVQSGRRRERRGEDGGGPATVRTRDGHFGFLFTPPNWPAVKALVDDVRLDDDRYSDARSRAEHQADFTAIVEAVTATQSKVDLYHRAQALNIPAGHVATISDLLDSPQYKARNLFKPVDVPGIGRGVLPDVPWQVFEGDALPVETRLS